MRESLNSLTIDQKVLVRIYGYGRGYFEGVVTKVTKTRVTVKYAGIEKIFTRDDGREYPRRSGFSQNSVEIENLTADGMLLIKKYRMARRARNLAEKLSKIFDYNNFSEIVLDAELSTEELDESIKMLETTYDWFKKYEPKEKE